MPHTSATDVLFIATSDLIEALKHPHPVLLSLNLIKQHHEALKKITNMFNEASKLK